MIKPEVLHRIATTIAEPIAPNLDEDIHHQVLAQIQSAFDEAQTRLITPDHFKTIVDAVIGPFQNQLSRSDYELLRERFHNAFKGYTASDIN